MVVAVIMVTTLVVVIVGSVWIWLALKPEEEDVITVKSEPKSRKKTGVGTALAVIKPDRIESEVKLDAVTVRLPKHVVAKTWMAVEWGVEEYKWKCACGRVDGSSSQSYSRDKAATHVRDSNRAEELKAQTNGRFSW